MEKVGVFFLLWAGTFFILAGVVGFVNFYKKVKGLEEQLQWWIDLHNDKFYGVAREHYRQRGEFHDEHEEFIKIAKRTTQGITDQVRLKAKFSEKTALMALDKANEALTRVGALERSTHRVVFKSFGETLDEESRKAWEAVVNPGNEENDWLEPVRDEINEDDPARMEGPQSFMPNISLDRRK